MRRLRCVPGVFTLALSGLAMTAGITPSRAAEPHRLVVLELFTSQGCSSCPPADALLREFSQMRADVLPLAFHVTYWNYLGWRDPFSFDGATQRQRLYAGRLPDGTVYTPQLVVDGTQDVVGSDRSGASAAIRRAVAAATSVATLTLRRSGEDIAIDVGAGQGNGAVYVVAYDQEHRTQVGRGENSGRSLVEANIVRSFAAVANWNGTALNLRQPRPAGERVAVFLQAPDGRILAAVKESEHES